MMKEILIASSPIHSLWTVITTATMGLLAFSGFFRTFLNLRPFQILPHHEPLATVQKPELATAVKDQGWRALSLNGLSAFARARLTGGSEKHLFAFEKSDRGFVSFYLGEVSGKSASAIPCRKLCSRMLKRASAICTDPKSVVSVVGEELGEWCQQGQKLKLLYGTLELSSGKLKLLSAGHPHPLKISESCEVERLDCPAGPSLGTGSCQAYEVAEYSLEPGDSLVLYSDESGGTGLTSLKQSKISQAAKKSRSPWPDLMVETMLEDLDDGRRQEDQSLLVLHFSGSRPA